MPDVLDRLRGRLEAYLSSAGRVFASVSPSPTSWTVVGVGLSLASGLGYYSGGYEGEVAGGLLILAAGWFDVVDGAVARVTGRVSKTGAFLDSTLDRVAEIAIFLGMLVGGYAPPALVLLALSLSLLVSYTRAKGDALGVRLSGVGVGERSERLLVLAVSSVLGYAVWGVVVVAVIAAYTSLERTVTAVRSLGRQETLPKT